MLAPLRRSIAMLIAGTLAACAGSHGTQAPPPADGDQTVGKPVSMMDTRVAIGSCPDSKAGNAKQMEAAVRKLVDPCTKVPGGAAHFSATFLPNGRIELASPSGDASEGVVPTCVLTNQLKHAIVLHQPCRFDVVLEATLGAGKDGGL